MVDTSYYGIIELEGDRPELVRVLQRITSGAFAGSKFESGTKAARIDMYHTEAYPLHLIGPAEIIWQAPSNPNTANRRIWLRLHPAIFSEVWDEFKIACLVPNTSSSTTSTAVPLQIRDLRSEIDSFELTGPLSGRVLKRILRVCHGEEAEKQGFYAALGNLRSTSALPEGLVAGLKVYDPRLQYVSASALLAPEHELMCSFPGSRLNRVDTATTSTDHDGIVRPRANVDATPALASSDIWNSAVRDELAVPKYTKYDLDKRRQKV